MPASEANGLSADARIMLDKVTTLRRTSLRDHIGTLESEHLLALERRPRREVRARSAGHPKNSGGAH